MKLVAICDLDGNVVSLMTFPEGGLRPSVPDLPPNHQEIEIDAPDISEDLEDSEVTRRLTELVRRSRVDVSRKEFVAR